MASTGKWSREGKFSHAGGFCPRVISRHPSDVIIRFEIPMRLEHLAPLRWLTGVYKNQSVVPKQHISFPPSNSAKQVLALLSVPVTK
ncbi:MAG: hypothetical protein UY29_C0023G0022 [Parcubacteria group bacterium GW2011_GWC2_48_17]|nr:MAG: hypothetical protein UY29_C0023G0022 [Parcubacteria group bacterium GW2011_GWC2_48_17]